MNFHQSVEDILKTATPEQRLMWNNIFLRYGERASLSQYVYTGLITGSELGTYVARKMYFAYSLLMSYQSANAAQQFLRLYSESNAEMINLSSSVPVWDVTAAAIKYQSPSYKYDNLLFSRIFAQGADYCIFIGYRITY